ncbi:MAG TPA: archease [Anaeromyxobacteraceae bacterium]|nr:archease [Anaeromyxobacteraceae bacterium]
MAPSSGPSRARHVIEEHTGELAIRLEAPTLPALFEEAGRALSGRMRGRALRGAPRAELGIAVSAPDREALLVEWLNELVFRAETEHVLFTDFRVERLSDRELSATALGRRVGRLRNPVKAATLHGLSVAEGARGAAATVILDV